MCNMFMDPAGASSSPVPQAITVMRFSEVTRAQSMEISALDAVHGGALGSNGRTISQ